ncbi:MAG: segregation/condensation protein A [Desulfobacterota bacterium]|nr:segregation/condensation protein A [Thermodesulfobacteriota bacterium]
MARHYTVKLDNFEGPLDLLLYLVRKNEIDIEHIPIVSITQQYLEYLELMKALNLDIAGEFLVMASTLLYLKSRALLPSGTDEDIDEEQTTLDDLKRQLLEYQQYKEAARHLKEQNILEKDVFTRGTHDTITPEGNEMLLQEASLFDLIAALQNVFKRSGLGSDVMELTAEEISVKDKMHELLDRLQTCTDHLVFEDLFQHQASRSEVIATFLALLELIRLQALRIYQNTSFGTIYIYPVAPNTYHALTEQLDAIS